MSTLLRSDFPATFIPTGHDLRGEFIQLNKLVRRSSAAVAKQIEEYVVTIYDAVKAGALTATEPDATVAATVQLKALYSDFTDLTRAERIKVTRLLALSDNVAVKASVESQVQFFLENLGWTFV